MANAKVVVCDSSGLISLLKEDDLNHILAVKVSELLTSEGWKVLVPHEVLAETINVFGKKLGRTTAVLVGESVIRQHDERELVLAPSELHVLKSALLLQVKANGGPSFVDCLVMAMADEYATSYIFGFDATFRKNGYSLPGSAERQ